MPLAAPLYCHFPTAADIGAIVALDQRCLGGLWSEAGYRRELDSPNSLFRVLSAVAPTLAPEATALPSTPSIVGIGCVWAILDEAHITVLGIDPSCQGKGLGQWLLLHLLQDAQQRQLHHATLEVRLSNTPAHRLYQKFGFQPVGQRRHYYRDGEDALLLWRSGLQNADFLQKLADWRTQILIRLHDQGWQVSNDNCAENRILNKSHTFDKI
jgi:[ribosomal protein S18]-alanine N-acetyltransferase